jgi:cardiolipin synthase
MEALQVAALKGVKIELVVPLESDQVLTTAAGRAYYADLLGMGVDIHLHSDGLLHSKTMSIDDAVALIGSGNFDSRSFHLNFEFNMLFYGSSMTAMLRHAQRGYMAQSQPLKLATWNRRSAWRRAADDVASLLGPLL